MRRQSAYHAPLKLARRGACRMTVLVTCAVVLFLLAIVGPGLLYQRQAERRLHCICRIKNLSLAMHNLSAGANGQLPSLTADFVSSPREDDRAEKRSIHLGWPVALLPALDSSELLTWIKTHDESQLADLRKGVTADRSGRGAYPLFLCPNDAPSQSGHFGLTYVANVGFMSETIFEGDPKREHRLGGLSWDGNGVTDETDDVEVSAATGVIWRHSDAFALSLDDISRGDGITMTIMFAENQQAGSWLDTDTTRIGFGVPIANDKQQVRFGRGSFFESVERPLNSAFSGTTLFESAEYNWRINRDSKAATGTRPRPSSNHYHGVTTAMCDGSCRFISQEISPLVYVKLITCNGVSYGEPPLRESEF